MATLMSSDTIVGVFDNQQHAREAIAELRRVGYTEDQIGVISQEPDEPAVTDAGTKIEEGAAAGLATGAGLGALWGLGILSNVVPGIGPAIFGGTLGVILSSAAAGAAAAGVGGALAGLGIPDEDAQYYEGEFKAGRTVVTVHGSPNLIEAQDILSRNGAYDRTTIRE